RASGALAGLPANSATVPGRAKGCSIGLILHRNRIEASPQVPGCDRAPRPPKVGDGKHGFARQPFAGVEMNRYRALQADIVDRKYVRTKLVKDEEHFRRPAPDALYVDQSLDQRLVVECFPAVRVKASRREMSCQTGQIFGLALRQAATAQSDELSSRDGRRREVRK